MRPGLTIQEGEKKSIKSVFGQCNHVTSKWSVLGDKSIIFYFFFPPSTSLPWDGGLCRSDKPSYATLQYYSYLAPIYIISVGKRAATLLVGYLGPFVVPSTERNTSAQQLYSPPPHFKSIIHLENETEGEKGKCTLLFLL